MASSFNKIDYKKEDVESIECKFVVHLKEFTKEQIDSNKKREMYGYSQKHVKNQDKNPPTKPRPDTHIVKEQITFKDGSKKANIRVIKDFKKPFWITKPHLRKHKQKKESEKIENLNEYSSTESGIGKEVAIRLGGRYIGRTNIRDIRDDPYVYGLDISSRAYIKKMYMDKFNKTSQSDLCVLDIEEDMIKKKVIVITVTVKDKSFTAIYKPWVDPDRDNTTKRINALYDKHIPKTPYTMGIKREYGYFDSEIQMVRAVFNKLHEWQPDFVEVWNIGYDVPRIIKICEDAGVPPKDIFSDPFLPEEYRHFNYREGQTHKLTEAGVFKPMDLHEQWHTVDCSASFFFVDGMSTYHFVRQGSKKVATGYGLDSILTKELGSKFAKLKFVDGKAEKLVKLPWHNYMVANRPLEYIVYNNYDTIGPLILDDETKDIQVTMSMLNGNSAFDIFNSGPKKIVEALHFFSMERGIVLGSKPNVMDDNKGLGLSNWIVLLPSYRIKQNGMACISESDSIITTVRGHTMDADQVSGYPSDGTAANVSKDTTSRELLEIDGIDKELFMLQNINLFFGRVNSLEYCSSMHNMPDMFKLLEDVEKFIKEEKELDDLIAA